MKKFLYLLILMALLPNCSPPVDHTPPLLVESVHDPETTTSIQGVWERVQQSETGFVRFSQEEADLWTEGIVISSDAGGNFYKELYVQDLKQNAKRALRLLLDRRGLHSLYPPGRKILIRLNGLGAGMHNGVLSLGAYRPDGVGALPDPLIDDHIIRTAATVPLQPQPIDLAQIHPDDVGKWVVLEGVQFARDALGKTYAGEAFDTFDGERRLVRCTDQRAIFLSSSAFAAFKSLIVDSLSGAVKGVLTRDYYNEKYIFKVISAADIAFDTARCDLPFEAAFENALLGRFEMHGWQHFIEKGSQYWEVYEDANSLGQSLRLGSFRSKDKKTVTWLILPPFDLSKYGGASLHFRSSTQYADKSVLEVLRSTQYNGDMATLTKSQWERIPARIASTDDNDRLWIDSGGIPLAGNAGMVYFAFRYTGSGKTAYDGTFELDDIRLIH